METSMILVTVGRRAFACKPAELIAVLTRLLPEALAELEIHDPIVRTLLQAATLHPTSGVSGFDVDTLFKA